jgi:hypothetical protein
MPERWHIRGAVRFLDPLKRGMLDPFDPSQMRVHETRDLGCTGGHHVAAQGLLVRLMIGLLRGLSALGYAQLESFCLQEKGRA